MPVIIYNLESSVVGDDSPLLKQEEEEYEEEIDVKTSFDDNQHACELSSDLIVDILLHCQSDKHLAQLKLVSKAWYSIISNLCLPKISPPSPAAQVSGFIILTISTETEITRVKFINDKGRKRRTNFGTAQDFQDCCNGLLLLACSSGVPIQYSLFNPSTNERITLPFNPNHNYSETNYASLAFDPSNSLSYRVIRLSRSAYDATVSSPPMLDIFWSETGTWSNHCVPLDPRVYGFKWFKRSIYIKGVLYKLSRAKFLICIDLKEERCLNLKASALELPERDKVNDSGFIGISRGYLHYSNRVESSILLWVLEDNKGGLRSWVLKHKIDMSYIIEQPVLVGCSEWETAFMKIKWFKTFALHPHRDEVFLGTPTFMLHYHLQTKHLELFYKVDTEDNIVCGEQMVFPYARCPAIINSVF